jgi:hypothetical protein
MLRVLVCGGRDYDNRSKLNVVLDALHRERPIGLIIHGGGKGADALAVEWGKSNDVKTVGYPADWARHGKSAGPRRSAIMLATERPDLVVAFPGGRGTADMCKRAKEAGVEVQEIVVRNLRSEDEFF